MTVLIAKFRFWLWGDETIPKVTLLDEFAKATRDLEQRVNVLRGLTERLSKSNAERTK